MSAHKTTFVALIRGVNVGGNTLKMDPLRKLCAGLGAEGVRTYVQSGNVVFAAHGSATEWTEKLEKKLHGKTRLPVSVMVRTAEEIEKIAASNPFLKEKGIEIARLGVTFLQQPPSKDALGKLQALEISPERFHLAGREIYLHCPNGFGQSKLYLLNKVLGQRTTVRNWNTVMKLHEMCAE